MTAIVVHSGGPTAVLNASLAGILDARHEAGIHRVYGARHGVAGLTGGDWVDLSGLTSEDRAAIRQAPGSVIGSSRKKLAPEEAASLMALLRERGIRYLLYTGGNGSMRTAQLLRETADSLYPELRVVGVPKTIDNDLAVTDHSPGYASAARFFAHALRDIGADNRALPPPVSIVEVIGRNTGWVVGATALARARDDDPPHLIYMPERPPSLDKICADIVDVHSRLGWVVVAVCEGLRDPAGEPFGAEVDRPGSRAHELASNLGHTLARAVTERTGLRARSEKPGLLGRSSALAVSQVDAEESYRCGYAALRTASLGQTGVMMALRRASAEPYRSEIFHVDLAEVAGVERRVPNEWISESGHGVTTEFLTYARPLVGDVPPHTRL